MAITVTRTGKTDEQLIVEFINNGVKEAVGQLYDEALEEAHTAALEKRDETVASLALRISKHMNFRDNGNTLTIEILKSDL